MSGFDLVSLVKLYADSITPAREYDTILKSIVEEVGELATEIAVAQGTKKRPPSPDGIKGEAIDVFITAVDMLCKAWGEDINSPELVGAVSRKLNKWNSFSEGPTVVDVVYHDVEPVPPADLEEVFVRIDSWKILEVGDVIEFGELAYKTSEVDENSVWYVTAKEGEDYSGFFPIAVSRNNKPFDITRRERIAEAGVWVDINELLSDGQIHKVNGAFVEPNGEGE